MGTSVEGPGTSVYSILLRLLVRLALPLLCIGIGLLILGQRLQSTPLRTAAWIVLGLSVLLLIPIVAGLAPAILGPAVRSMMARRSLSRVQRALDAAERSGNPETFRAACAHVRQMYGASYLDDRLLDGCRPSREAYLGEATDAALEHVARRLEDPLASRAWLEGLRRRDPKAVETIGQNLEAAWRAAMAPKP